MKPFRWFKPAAESFVKVPFIGAVSHLTLAVCPFCIAFAVLWAVFRQLPYAWIGQDILVSVPLSVVFEASHCSCDNNWYQTMYLSGHCTDSYGNSNCQSTQPQGNQIAVDSWLSACCWPLPRVFLITGEVSVLFTFWPWSGGFGSSQLCLPVWHLLGVCLQEVVSWECDDCGMYYKRAS